MKQHSTPVRVSEEATALLSRVEPSADGFDESWIQQLVFSHPETLPISEIEPAFGDAIAVCREMATDSGYCDIVLVNAMGYVTVVECKLWKNPEGRRQVVAQTIDYAKDLSRMSYATFERRCLDARGDRSESLFALIHERFPDADQTSFIDGVQRNLRSARIMLLIVGDGIRENTVELTEFLQRYATLRFAFGLVELPVYRLDDGAVLVTPRVLTKTLEIIRAVVARDHDGRETLIEANEGAVAQSSSETVFFDRLAQSRGTVIASGVRDLVTTLRTRLGIVAKLGRGKSLSLNLKSANDGLNFASIQQDGLVYFYGIVSKAGELGERDVGIHYLDKLAAIVDGSVDRSMKEWNWCVKKNVSVRRAPPGCMASC